MGCLQFVRQARNLTRMVWVNVAPPPVTEKPPHIKGKTPTTDVTAAQLRRRKIDALKLALAFVVAAKHYLRGEDGLLWEDFTNILPRSYVHHDESDYGAIRTVTPPPISAIKDGSSSPDRQSERSSLNATKRVRPKRAKDVPSGSSSPRTGDHRVDMGGSGSELLTIPLPLMFVQLIDR